MRVMVGAAALRRVAAAEPVVEIRAGVRATGLLTSQNGAPHATGVAVDDGDPVHGDVVVDALGRYRCPKGWPRATGEPSDSGAIYYCRYIELAEGVELSMRRSSTRAVTLDTLALTPFAVTITRSR